MRHSIMFCMIPIRWEDGSVIILRNELGGGIIKCL